MLTLYVAKNTVAFASHLALEETGLPYRVQWLVMANNDQRTPDYLAVNPKGRVPALITDHGTLTETPAVLEYIAEITGKLMPSDPIAKARVRELLAYLAATMHVNHAHGHRGARWSDDPAAHASMRAKVTENMAQNCDYVETLMPDTGWYSADLSIADMHLYTVCRWLATDGVDIATYPKLAAHFTAMKTRPSVITVENAHG